MKPTLKEFIKRCDLEKALEIQEAAMLRIEELSKDILMESEKKDEVYS